MLRIKLGLLSIALLLVTGLLSVMAQDDAAYSAAANGVGFNYSPVLGPNVNIVHYAGDAIEGAGPGFSDARHFQFLLYDAAPAAESLFERGGGLRVYRRDDLARYDFLQNMVDQLETLLSDRPDLASYMAISQDTMISLPMLPVITHPQVIRARAAYVETAAVQGISYIFVSNAAAEPFLAHSFLYSFQGLSRDGQYYVSMIVPVGPEGFPEEDPADFDMMAFQESLPDYYNESTATLNAAAPESFSPALPLLEDVIQSLSFA